MSLIRCASAGYLKKCFFQPIRFKTGKAPPARIDYQLRRLMLDEDDPRFRTRLVDSTVDAEHIMKKSDQFSKDDRVMVPAKDDLTKVTGVPEEHQQERLARIYIPAKASTQSGTHGNRLWRVDFDNRQRRVAPLESMPISVDRDRRPNAGARMPKLLNEEDNDDFYTNAYGGFTEEADDVDYESETSVEDSVDSDFANGSNSSGSSDSDGEDAEDEEGRRKRNKSRRIPSKSHSGQKEAETEELVRKVTSGEMGEAGSTEPVRKKVRRVTVKCLPSDVISEPRTLRQSTTQATTESSLGRRRLITKSDTAVRRKAMLAEIAQRKNVPEVRRLTQAELLAEARVTEEINKRSLARYQRMEVEKKKARIQKNVHSTPMIRYHSFTVPIIEDQPDVYAVSVTSHGVRAGPLVVDPAWRCSRNLVTFADSDCLQALMPASATPLPQPGNVAPAPRTRSRLKPRCRTCPISGLPARYFDPLTQTPYANLAAFRMLRRLYAIHLETNVSPVELLREYRST